MTNSDFDVTKDEIEDVIGKARDKRTQSGRIVKPVTDDSHLDYIEDQIDSAFKRFIEGRDSLDDRISGDWGSQDVYERARRCVSTLPHFPSQELSRYFKRKADAGPDSRQLGIFFSSLLNRMLREGEEIFLDARTINDPYSLKYVCSFLERGTVTIKGNSGECAAQHVKRGAKVIFEGESEKDSGNFLDGGEIEFRGPAETDILKGMKDGHAIVHQFKNEPYPYSSFGANQEEGKIDVMCDVSMLTQSSSIGACQKGGEINFHGTVTDCSIGPNKEYGDISVKRAIRCKIGYKMTGGEIVLGSVQEGIVGERTLGGTIHVKGSARANISEGSSGCTIIVGGDVTGNVGGRGDNGVDITVHGNVKGDVGRGSKYITCTIEGNVTGNIQYVGYGSSSGPKSQITVHKSVYGTVGYLNWADVHVGRKIERLEKCSEGCRVYENGGDVTPTTANLIARGIFKKLLGD